MVDTLTPLARALDDASSIEETSRRTLDLYVAPLLARAVSEGRKPDEALLHEAFGSLMAINMKARQLLRLVRALEDPAAGSSVVPPMEAIRVLLERIDATVITTADTHIAPLLATAVRDKDAFGIGKLHDAMSRIACLFLTIDSINDELADLA